VLFEKVHRLCEDFEAQCQQHIYGYSKSIDLIIFRTNLFVAMNNELDEMEHQYEFTSINEETKYYKIEKPKFQKYGIFYSSLLKIELNVPLGSHEMKEAYYMSALVAINQIFIKNQDHIVYYRMQSTKDDYIIFTKKSSDNYIFALIEATIMMEEFLYNINDPRSISEKISDYPKLTWTGTLSNLVVLVKALVKSGSINNGNATIKDVVYYVQIMFNVDLKDYHRKYQDVKNSQNPIKFLEYLCELITDDVDIMDEKSINQSKK
jgi:RteC protein